MRQSSITWVRVVAFVAGCALAVGYLAAGRVPAQGGPLAARVAVSTARAGQLGAAPGHRIIRSQPLHPGRKRDGAVLLSNPTRVALRVRPVAAAPPTELDDGLQLQLVADGRRVFVGSLAELRRGKARRFEVPSGARTPVWVRAWLAHDPRGRHGGRVVDARIEWRTDVARR